MSPNVTNEVKAGKRLGKIDRSCRDVINIKMLLLYTELSRD